MIQFVFWSIEFLRQQKFAQMAELHIVTWELLSITRGKQLVKPTKNKIKFINTLNHKCRCNFFP